MIVLSPFACIFAAALLLLLPLNWLFAAFFAAAAHEAGHWLAITLCGCRVDRIRIGCRGIQLEAVLPGPGQELLCAAAGPAVSFALLLLSHVFPRLAVCGFFQGAFNLLPVFPLDGGRIVHCLLQGILPSKADRITEVSGWVVTGLLLLAALAGLLWLRLGYVPLLCWIGGTGIRKNSLQNRGKRSTIGLPFQKR